MARITLAAVPIVAAFISGCTTTHIMEGPAPGIRTTSDTGIGHDETLNTVVILDDSLGNKIVQDEFGKKYPQWPWRSAIAVESTGVKRTPTDTLEVWAILRNRTTVPLQVEARTSFYDTAQAPAGPASVWKRVFLQPNSTNQYLERSLDVDVSYYRIEVREGR